MSNDHPTTRLPPVPPALPYNQNLPEGNYFHTRTLPPVPRPARHPSQTGQYHHTSFWKIVFGVFVALWLFLFSLYLVASALYDHEKSELQKELDPFSVSTTAWTTDAR